MNIVVPKKNQKPCHWGKKLAFEHKGLKFYGAGLERGYNPSNSRAFHVCLLEAWELSLSDVSNFTCWYMPTKDYTAPNTDALGLSNLMRAIREYIKGTSCPEIVVFCAGGHGRTGTLLAVLHSFITGSADPITAIQESYCIQALETKEQVAWVSCMAEVDVEEHINKDWYS
jgi:protein-tyrosine phosphatase